MRKKITFQDWNKMLSRDARQWYHLRYQTCLSSLPGRFFFSLSFETWALLRSDYALLKRVNKWTRPLASLLSFTLNMIDTSTPFNMIEATKARIMTVTLVHSIEDCTSFSSPFKLFKSFLTKSFLQARSQNSQLLDTLLNSIELHDWHIRSLSFLFKT